MALMEMQLALGERACDEHWSRASRASRLSCASNWSMAALPAEAAPLGQKIAQNDLEIIGALHRAGVPIVAGTDQTVPGFSVYREIELYVQAGFTPMEALQAATIVPARAMKVERDSGSLEVGKRADLDVLDANPLENIHNIRSVHSVVADGVLYDPRSAVGERWLQAGTIGRAIRKAGFPGLARHGPRAKHQLGFQESCRRSDELRTR